MYFFLPLGWRFLSDFLLSFYFPPHLSAVLVLNCNEMVRVESFRLFFSHFFLSALLVPIRLDSCGGLARPSKVRSDSRVCALLQAPSQPLRRAARIVA